MHPDKDQVNHQETNTIPSRSHMSSSNQARSYPFEYQQRNPSTEAPTRGMWVQPVASLANANSFNMTDLSQAAAAAATTTATATAEAVTQGIQARLTVPTATTTAGHAQLQPPQAPTTTTEATEPHEQLGIPRSSYKRLLVQCGLVPGEEDYIPIIWKQLGEKGMTKADKKLVVKHEIKATVLYLGTKLVPFVTLVQMIVKSDFEEDTSRSSLKLTAKGLTPFAVPVLSDMDIDRINE